MLFKKKSQDQTLVETNVKQKPKKTMATLRLHKDLVQYKQEEISFVKLSFPAEENIQLIHLEIIAQKDSIYADCHVSFKLQFPDSYPMDPPKLQCLNKIYHPNISYKGNVCLPLVRQDFAPTVTLTSIICGLIYILTYPNAEDALIPEIGDLMIKDFEMFKKIVEHTIEGRVFKNLEYDKLIVRSQALKKVEHNYKGQTHEQKPMIKKTQSEQPQIKQRLERIQDLHEKTKKLNFELEEN